jgi:hypothetical protein
VTDRAAASAWRVEALTGVRFFAALAVFGVASGEAGVDPGTAALAWAPALLIVGLMCWPVSVALLRMIIVVPPEAPVAG